MPDPVLVPSVRMSLLLWDVTKTRVNCLLLNVRLECLWTMIEVKGNKGKYSLLPQQFESDYSFSFSTCLIFNDILMIYIDASCLLKLY
jgi:hypothetical protein